MKFLRILASALVILSLLFIVPSARAVWNTNYCFPTFTPDRCLSLMQVMENWAQRMFAGLGIGMMKGAAQTLWLLDRAAAFIYNASVVNNGWLMNLKTQMNQLFASMMPELLQSIAFGSGGLMYIALSISGLVMMIPMWSAGARFVRPERVMGWGVILSVLFVGGSFGYDFIGQVETFRQGLVTGIVQGASMPLDNLIQQPMFAGSGDLGFSNDLLRLPPAFESTYFPDPQLLEVTISEGGGFGFGNANIEREEELKNRITLAGQGIFYAVISGFGAWLLVMVGITYIILAFTALILIIFIFAAMPLGFFEIGGMILTDLAGRYFQVTIQSLTLAIFLRWLSSGLGFVVDVNSVPNALTWLVVIIVMIIVTGSFLSGALKLLTQSVTQGFRAVTTAGGGGAPIQSVREGIGGTVSRLAGGIATVSMLAGRPEVAMAAGAVQAGSARVLPQSQGAGSQSNESAPPPRGNVFAGNGTQSATAAPSVSQAAPAGMPDLTPQAASAGVSASAPLPPAIPSGTSMPQATLQTIAARQGWDAVQMRQVEESARETKTPQEAVQRLQQAPGFERTAPQELQKAVEAARLGIHPRNMS